MPSRLLTPVEQITGCDAAGAAAYGSAAGAVQPEPFLAPLACAAAAAR